ncbi:MAG: beta-propeller domain-containing protein [Proteobacteria bacterium]|nr:beta-propeller domain-containing protein [Pseudomonadota bacterium]
MNTKLAAAIALLFGLGMALPTATPAAGLKPLNSDAEFTALVAKWKQKAQRDRSAAAPMPASAMMEESAPVAMPPPAPAPAVGAMAKAAPAAGANAASITNVQTQGVDEGDIVKAYGDFLIVLRRGRLFTVRVGGDALKPVSAVNAYAPDVDPQGTWYDEMLVNDGRIVVIGYSYARGGTEVGLFDIGRDGTIAYRATYQMRSSDYYSSRNYASRLIGHQLIFYAPMPVNLYGNDPYANFPALRRWQGNATPGDFQRILPATRIYRSTAELDPRDGITLHSITSCDLAAAQMSCKASAVLGPSGRVFYVSADAVYVWTRSWNTASTGNSSLFRIPLDGSTPTGLRTTGSPIDQMSFLQRDGWLNVLLNREGRGEGMWAANGPSGAMALLRVRLSEFGDGSDIAPPRDYRVLAGAEQQWSLQNRYVGDWLLFGSASSNTLHALRYAQAGAMQDVALKHSVQRIDALGNDAVVVGPQGGDLHFSSIALGREAKLASDFVQANAAQADARTHGFFYRADGERKGIIGLPILDRGGGSAAVLYLRNLGLRLSRMGSLDAKASRHVDDACKASCVDWYGNARPIFLGDRVFALLGYELVEGSIKGNAIGERRRVNFAPAANVAW